MGEYSLEPCFKVYNDSNGTYLEVRVDPDTPGIVLLSTPDKASKEYYGDIHLTMSIAQAELLSKAIEKQTELMQELEV